MNAGQAPNGPISSAVQGLSPGYFALVMASGIVSIGMRLIGRPVISDVLLGVCGAAYVVLVMLTLWRLVRYRACEFNRSLLAAISCRTARF